jgi:multidrug resistance protein, MATE family
MTNDKSPDTRREAIITGDLRRTLLRLALPVLLEQFLSFCVGLYDTFLAGHLPGDVSDAATGAVGIGAYVSWLATLLFSFVSAGTTALVARAQGRGDLADAVRVTNRSYALGLMVGITFAACAIPLAGVLSRFVLTDDQAVGITARYLRIDSIGLIFSSVSYMGAAALRGSGNMRTPMLIFAVVAVLNAAASTLLVFGLGPVPGLGIDGIVLGTVIARITGGTLMTAVLVRGASGLTLKVSEFRLDDTVRRILSIGMPAALDGLVMWIGHYLFLKIIGSFGTAVLAAHMVGIRVEALTYLPAVAWAAAAATMIGQSLGAGLPERARRAGHEAVLQCGLLGVIITVAFYFGAEPIYRGMHNSEAVIDAGAPAFRMLALFQLPLVAGIVYAGGLRGAGDTRVPMWITLFTTLMIRLPVAWLCGVVLNGGLYGAWIGMCLDMLLRGVLVAVRFWRGGWEREHV